MTVLSSAQRKLLEEACILGRKAAEQAARAAITVLAVNAERPPAHLSENDRQLRRGHRAKARQLGDTGDQLDLLVADCAYEQWHRLLFARFLAENGLLIHPDFGASVTIEDCEELAEELGEPDGWAVASRFAAEILPGIFRLDDPCVRLRLAPEGRLRLEGIVSGLPADVFLADDALGWVYQFWQKEKKDEINRSERKVGGSDLGPVTQLFTENYMVRFLLQNSLGGWWAARHPASPLVKEWDYLRLDDDGRPAAGSFDEWPDSAAAVTVMDPCCGSGHFLVEAFSMLWRMRAEEEGLDLVAAQDAVLRDNLFGLELDPRCVQIAMFSLAWSAWVAGRGWRELPVPHVACTGISLRTSAPDWEQLAKHDTELADVLRSLNSSLRHASTIGSLMDPRRDVERIAARLPIDEIDWDRFQSVLEQVLAREARDPAAAVFGASAVSAIRSVSLLARKYTLIATNPPWLQRTRQDVELQQFGDAFYGSTEGELALMFLHRCRGLIGAAGAISMVLPQQWLEISSYEEFRRETLNIAAPALVAQLGAQAFRSPMHPGNRTALYIEREGDVEPSSCTFIPLRGNAKADRKATELKATTLTTMDLADLRKNPELRIVPLAFGSSDLLSDYAYSYAGVQSHDSAQYIRRFWELAVLDGEEWIQLQSTVAETVAYGGREYAYLWEDGRGRLAALQRDYPQYMKSLYFRGDKAWGRLGVAIGQMYQLECTLYSGDAFDNNSAVIVPNETSDLGALWQFCISGELNRLVRMIDSKMGVTNATLTKIPIDIDYWRRVAADAGPLPAPWSDDPTQWLFKGRPENASEPLQVGVARLLGYRWPHQDPDELDVLRDADGIVCLPSVRGERRASDRLQELLARAFGGTWTPARTQELIAKSGSVKNDLDAWLRDDFFKSHCQVFKNRPFIWHVWDGRKDGFGALVNYHRLDRPTLEKLAYSYLGDWIERQDAAARDDVPGAEERLAAAGQLQRRLELILEGQPQYDIYVRWKLLAEQPIGWEPNVNDGVRLNVRPFVEAGVLRAKFNVKWDKDRGKNVDGSDRVNDLHFTHAQKIAARQGKN